MNVKKLIDILNQVDQNLEVVYINSDCEEGSEVIIVDEIISGKYTDKTAYFECDENIDPSLPNHDMLLLKGF